MFSLIQGGNLTVAAIIAGGILLIIGYVYARAYRDGMRRKELEEAKARAENLDRIKRAASAYPDVGLSDDPNNRDN